MRARHFLIMAVTAAAAAPASAQDPTKVEKGKYTVVAENERLRVLRINIPAGDKGVMHEHPDAIVVALTPANIRFTLPDGSTRDTTSAAWEVAATPAGKHRPENRGGAFEAVMVELKAPGAPDPALVETPRTPKALMRTVTRLASIGRASANRIRFEPGYEEDAGTTHVHDSVAIPSSDGDATLTMGGRTVALRKGEVYLMPRGVPHQARVSSPMEIIVIPVE